MSPPKKQSYSNQWLQACFSWLLGPGRSAFVLAITITMFGAGWWLAWQKIGPRIVDSSEYRVGPEQIEIIAPTSPWIHADVRAEVFRSSLLDGPLSIMDDDLVERIAKAFSLHPWVANVRSVAKHHPARVTVELTYRKPVCMVEVPDGVLPVDAEGILLPHRSPEDFSPVEASRYPHLVGVDRKPAIAPGARWGHPIVIGGAEIAAALESVWTKMNLHHIVTTAAIGDARGRLGEPTFSLVARSGTQIFWGYAPGANAPGELSVAEKVARLEQYWSGHDTLDGPQGQRQSLDIRALRSPLRP